MAELDAQWEQYKQKFGKKYGSEEDKVRRALWEESLKRVEAHNKEADEGKHTWWMGINQFSDKAEEMGRKTVWKRNLMEVNIHNLEASMGLHTYTMGINHLSDLTKEEFKEIYAPLKLPKYLNMTLAPLPDVSVDIPDSVDWRKYGFVTSVRDQGNCMSCWAFSAVGALEGLLAKTTGRLMDLSPQNLVDCSQPYGNEGCAGGWPHQAFQYVIDNRGIESEAFYPYEGMNGPCRYKPSHQAAISSTCYAVPQDEQSLKKASALFGPISIGIDASNLHHYTSGVFSGNCGQNLNHAVLLVGYGTDATTQQDYWLVKNSWGETWGEGGYIRIARNQNQMCGISLYSVFPT